MNTQIFAERLKNARVMKGYSMDELCSAMNNSLSKMAISKYENNKLSPSSSVLISFSKALNQPLDYFFRPFTLNIQSVKFRKKSSLSVKDEKSIKENIADKIERYLNIEEICNANIDFASPFNQSVSTNEEMVNAAKKLHKLWNLGDDGIVNVIELLEEHGMKVVELDAPISFDGLSSIVNSKYPVIVLNKNFSSERKRFTALHELGHIMFTFSTYINSKQEESLCNVFANEMLILSQVFKNKLGASRHDISYQELKAIQLQYGISCDAMMYKAKLNNIISEQRYKTYCIKKNQNASFKNLLETSLYPEEKTSRFNSLVYKALSNDLITVSKAAALLQQSVETVRINLTIV